jgi:hypothetical protein
MVIDPPSGHAPINHRAAMASLDSRRRGASLLRSLVYEITLAGRVGAVTRAEFDDCEVSIGQDTTTLRVELPDQGALWGIILRIMGFGLKLIELRLLAVPGIACGIDPRAAEPADLRLL